MHLPFVGGEGWSHRVLKPELLDTAGPGEAGENLQDMVFLNRWFGPHRALRGILNDLVYREERFSVLDIGAGSGDLGKCIRGSYRYANVVSLDRRSVHLRNAEGPRVVADAWQLPFAPKTFDFVLCSSFLHHFPDDEVIRLISEFRRYARRCLIVLDLERNPFAISFLPMTKALFRWSPLTIHDGPVSVAAGFRQTELTALFRAAGAGFVKVKRHRPWFRLSAIAPASVSDEANSIPALVESASCAR
jgi:SAM-dependent methyltransferase